MCGSEECEPLDASLAARAREDGCILYHGLRRCNCNGCVGSSGSGRLCLMGARLMKARLMKARLSVEVSMTAMTTVMTTMMTTMSASAERVEVAVERDEDAERCDQVWLWWVWCVVCATSSSSTTWHDRDIVTIDTVVTLVTPSSGANWNEVQHTRAQHAARDARPATRHHDTRRKARVTHTP